MAFNYYDNTKGTLKSRMLRAWTDLNAPKLDEKQRVKVLSFLMFAFDIVIDTSTLSSEHKRARALIQKLGQLIKMLKESSSGSIPGKYEHLADRSTISLNQRSVTVDSTSNPVYLTEEGRAKHRILIRKGKFFSSGRLFDTSGCISHYKPGYVSYTLNAQGELSVFNHYAGLEDGSPTFHSSMNAGQPVIAAGELKIENGILKEITTRSGHYTPSLLNVYNLLEHLQARGVDITEVDVVTKNPVKKGGETISKPRVLACELRTPNEEPMKLPEGDTRHFTPASEVYSSIDSLLTRCVQSIASYQKGGLLTLVFSFFNQNLTESRKTLADNFRQAFEAAKNNKKLNPIEKEAELLRVVDDYISRNNDLSAQHKKDKNTGRLHNKLTEIKEKITTESKVDIKKTF